jgi:hypothetical protein
MPKPYLSYPSTASGTRPVQKVYLNRGIACILWEGKKTYEKVSFSAEKSPVSERLET